MARKYLLFAGKEIDTDKQTVAVNQLIQMEGYSYDKYVVCKVEKSERGVQYKLINLHTKEFDHTDLVQPLSEKFGIGYYYDDKEPAFMDSFEVALLLQEAEQNQEEKYKKDKQEKVRVETVKAIGRKRLAEILPANAQAVIVAELKQDESDIQTDYIASSTQRTVILGFSTHKRDIFSEMRKYAANFDETAHLATCSGDYEHREKYAMGAGYFLGESQYHGWIIKKLSIYDRNRLIEELAYTAGDEANIRLKKSDSTPPNTPKEGKKGDCTLVEYSAKAVAVFGETKAIKDELMEMGGRFNSRLTFNGQKLAGWIFPKSKEQRLAYYFGLD